MTATADLLGLFPAGTSRDGDGMLRVGGCRLDDWRRVRHSGADRRRGRGAAAGPGLPGAAVRPVADSQVAFASKAFPCTAVQR